MTEYFALPSVMRAWIPRLCTVVAKKGYFVPAKRLGTFPDRNSSCGARTGIEIPTITIRALRTERVA